MNTCFEYIRVGFHFTWWLQQWESSWQDYCGVMCSSKGRYWTLCTTHVVTYHNVYIYIYIYKKIRYKNKKQYFFNPNLWFVWYRTTMYAQIFVRFLPIARNTRDHCACTQNNGGHGFYSQWNVQYSDIDSAFKWVFTTFLQRIMILIVTIIFQWL